MVNVAQLVEHQIVALGVVGSIPTIHPKIEEENGFWHYFGYSWYFLTRQLYNLSA